MSEKFKVNMIACDGHGLCAELVPELIRLDEWGYPILAPTSVPPELAKHARKAVRLCPELALTLVSDRAASHGVVAASHRGKADHSDSASVSPSTSGSPS
jgi:ferredoxin